MKNYLIDYQKDTETYVLLSEMLDRDSMFLNYQLVAKDIPPELISAAIYQLLESLKDHTPEGHEKATAE